MHARQGHPLTTVIRSPKLDLLRSSLGRWGFLAGLFFSPAGPDAGRHGKRAGAPPLAMKHNIKPSQRYLLENDEKLRRLLGF